MCSLVKAFKDWGGCLPGESTSLEGQELLQHVRQYLYMRRLYALRKLLVANLGLTPARPGPCVYSSLPLKMGCLFDKQNKCGTPGKPLYGGGRLPEKPAVFELLEFLNSVNLVHAEVV